MVQQQENKQTIQQRPTLAIILLMVLLLVRIQESTSTINNTGYSDTPQSNINDIDSNEYLTEYTHNEADNTITNNTSTTTSNTTTNTDSGKSDKTIKEVVTRTADNEIDLLIKFQTEYNNIWTMLYRDLDCLFYGLV